MVGTESIQTPLNCSLFVSLQPFAKIKKVKFYFSLKKLKYHMVLLLNTEQRV